MNMEFIDFDSMQLGSFCCTVLRTRWAGSGQGRLPVGPCLHRLPCSDSQYEGWGDTAIERGQVLLTLPAEPSLRWGLEHLSRGWLVPLFFPPNSSAAACSSHKGKCPISHLGRADSKHYIQQQSPFPFQLTPQTRAPPFLPR